MSEVSPLRPSDMSSLSVPEVSTFGPVQETVPDGADHKGWWLLTYWKCFSLSNYRIPGLLLKKSELFLVSMLLLKTNRESGFTSRHSAVIFMFVSAAGGCRL